MNSLRERLSPSMAPSKASPPRPAVAPSPMDLVCRRMVRKRLRPAAAPGEAPHEFRVTLPNPRFPLPAPPVLRHGSGGGELHGLACWGAGAPGALDVALNVMAAYLPFRVSDRSGAVRAESGAIVSRRAERHYEAFSREFLETMPPEGGVVTEAEIRDWIARREGPDAA